MLCEYSIQREYHALQFDIKHTTYTAEKNIPNRYYMSDVVYT